MAADTHVCECGDCAVAAFVDKCKFEQRVIELEEQVALMARAGDELARRLRGTPGIDIMRGFDIERWQRVRDGGAWDG